MNILVQEWLTRRARQAAPNEVCGFVLEGDEIVEIRNVSLAPMRGFKMCRNQLIEKMDGRIQFITGIWHTHPRGTNHPSPTDLEGIKDGAIHPDWDYFVVTGTEVVKYDTGLYAPPDPHYWNRFREGVRT